MIDDPARLTEKRSCAPGEFFVRQAAEHRSLELCWLDEQSDSGRKGTITASQPFAYFAHERDQFAFQCGGAGTGRAHLDWQVIARPVTGPAPSSIVPMLVTVPKKKRKEAEFMVRSLRLRPAWVHGVGEANKVSTVFDWIAGERSAFNQRSHGRQ